MSDRQGSFDPALQQRLARNSISDPQTGCILWTGSRNTSGYGQVRWRGPLLLVHRAAWMERHGPIAPGMCVLHRCDVRSCLNPDHLFVGTQKDNMADLAAKNGHERRVYDGGPERRPSKAPEIMRVQLLGREFVTRVLEIRVLEPQRKARSAAEARLLRP